MQKPHNCPSAPSTFLPHKGAPCFFEEAKLNHSGYCCHQRSEIDNHCSRGPMGAFDMGSPFRACAREYPPMTSPRSCNTTSITAHRSALFSDHRIDHVFRGQLSWPGIRADRYRDKPALRMHGATLALGVALE
jgi:hypothetical protein